MVAVAFCTGEPVSVTLTAREVIPEAGGVGYVPAENLEGKAQVILLSWKAGASIFKPWTWVMNIQPSRFFTLLH